MFDQDEDEGPTIEEVDAEYLLTRESQGVSKNTLRVYRYALAHRRAWRKARGVTHIKRLTTTLIKQYLVDLRGSKNARTGEQISDRTVRHYAVISKGQARFAYEQGYIQWELLYKFQIPKAKKPSVYNPSQADAMLIFEWIERYYSQETASKSRYWWPRAREFFAARLKAVLAIQVSTGMRIGETLRIEGRDVDAENSAITVRRTKNGEDRVVPLSPVLARELKKWAKRRPKASTTEYLFVTETGTKCEVGTITHQYQRCLSYARENGVTLPRITMHALRHHAINSFAQGNKEHARIIAGHQSASTTDNYLHNVPEEVRATHAARDPLAGILVNPRSKAELDKKPRGRSLIEK